MRRSICRFGRPDKDYSLRVDPIHSRYKKADEALREVLRNTVARDAPHLRGHDIVKSVLTVDSKKTFGIQLGDLLLGAVMAARENIVTDPAKLKLMAHIGHHLGWPDLAGSTFAGPAKFNIWRFWDPSAGNRRREFARRTLWDRWGRN